MYFFEIISLEMNDNVPKLYIVEKSLVRVCVCMCVWSDPTEAI